MFYALRKQAAWPNHFESNLKSAVQRYCSRQLKAKETDPSVIVPTIKERYDQQY